MYFKVSHNLLNCLKYNDRIVVSFKWSCSISFLYIKIKFWIYKNIKLICFGHKLSPLMCVSIATPSLLGIYSYDKETFTVSIKPSNPQITAALVHMFAYRTKWTSIRIHFFHIYIKPGFITALNQSCSGQLYKWPPSFTASWSSGLIFRVREHT